MTALTALAASEQVPTAAEGVFSLMWLLIGFPLAGAVILLLAGKRADSWGHVLGTLTVLSSFIVAAFLFFAEAARDADTAQGTNHAEGPPLAQLADDREIDAYLGAHHDTDLSAMDVHELDLEEAAELATHPREEHER